MGEVRNKVDEQRELTFLTPSGELEIRMVDLSLSEYRSAAETLGARYFIVNDPRNQQHHIYDMQSWAGRGMRPIRSFPYDAREAALMFARMQGAS